MPAPSRIGDVRRISYEEGQSSARLKVGHRQSNPDSAKVVTHTVQECAKPDRRRYIPRLAHTRFGRLQDSLGLN